MPIFTRRRIQWMFHELMPYLAEEKARDLLSRLEDKRVEQALPGEAELALLWALSRLGELDIEPYWWADEHRPDAYSENLVKGSAAVIEIAATNDNSLSGHAEMDRVALEICNFANRLRPSLGRYLYFRFREESGYQNGSYFRRRLAPKGFRLSDCTRRILQRWITSGEMNRTPLRIVEPGLDVTVEVKQYKQTRFHNIWSSMPVEAYSLEKNPLFELLRRKLDQLAATPVDTIRLLFLMDVGSMLLHWMGQNSEGHTWQRKFSATQIISHFVSRYRDRIDSVVVFIPKQGGHIQSEPSGWDVRVFNRPDWSRDLRGVEQLASYLPRPRFAGYQVRSLFLQDAFSPTAKGWYLPTTIQSKNNKQKMKISARALLDLLADRITVEQFRYFNGQRPGDKNLFQHWLNLGFTFSDVYMERSCLDKDDDWLVFSFEDDPAAGPLK